MLDALAEIERHPHRFPKTRYRTSRDIRQCRLAHFPYSIIYELHDVNGSVIAVAHARRRPGYWRDRLA
jgi:hypothetical protein